MNKTTWTILTVAFLLVGGYMLYARQPAPVVAPGAEETTVDEVMTVSYTDTGFSPATLTVTAGTTVAFVNQSGGSMWVASSPHPTHTDYPDFDQNGAGESYSYTFSEAGTYRYHNHLNPSSTGTVVVE